MRFLLLLIPCSINVTRLRVEAGEVRLRIHPVLVRDVNVEEVQNNAICQLIERKGRRCRTLCG